MPEKYPIPTNIYHITSVENLPSILENGGLLAFSNCLECGIQYSSIAHKDIQDKREITEIKLPPDGTLHDYVPFYFAPRSPMLYAIKMGIVEGYEAGQRQVIHLVSSVQEVIKYSIPFVFTDGHAIMGLSNFFNREEDLEKIDWKIMEQKYWRDTNNDLDRKRRRQAEFLVHKFFPWNLIKQIAVMDKDTESIVNNYIQNSVHKPDIVVERAWYY